MAVVSRIARITLSNGLASSREWLATAAVQDTAAGDAVTITVTQSTTGAAPPGTANSVRQMQVLNESGGVIATYSWAEGAASTQFTHYMTSNGLIGGTPLADTFEILLRVQKTNGGPTATYNVESDGSPNEPPTLFTSSTDRGWIRSTTTATISASNVSLGGSKNEPAQYQDSLFVRTVLGAGSSISRSLTAQFTGSSKSKASASTTSATKDVTFSGSGIAEGRVNEGFPASSSTYTATVDTPSNSALTGQPWTVLTRTNDTLLVDPRLTAAHLFQLDMNSYATPPLAGQNLDNERPATSIGYFATHIRAARGAIVGDVASGGVNGVSITTDLVAQSNGDTVSRSETTTTQNGEDGWSSDFLQWTSPLPGGGWDKTVEITAPSDINASGYLLNAAAVYQLIASRNPFIQLIAEIGHADGAANDRHMHTGDSVEVNAYFKQTKSGERQLLFADESPPPAVSYERIRNNRVENLVYDAGAYEWNWESAEDDGVLEFYDMTKVSDYYWNHQVPSDDTWGDVTVNVAAQYEAVQYDAAAFREFVGTSFAHDLDQDATFGVLLSVYDATTGVERARRHLREVGDDLEILLVPRTGEAPDPSVDRLEVAFRRVRNGAASQDLTDIENGPWVDIGSPSHPNSNNLIYTELNLLPTGAAIVRIPEAILDLDGNDVPWIIVIGRATYNLGQPNEYIIPKDLQVMVYPNINRHDKVEDPWNLEC